MSKKVKAHYPNGVLSELRKNAAAPNKEFIKKAIIESQKVKSSNVRTVFNGLSKKKTEKLLSGC